MVKKILVMSLAMSLVFVSLASAEEPVSSESLFLRETSEKKMDLLLKESRIAFKVLVFYPKDIREAILEVSQFPEFIILLDNQQIVNQEMIKEWAQQYPPEAVKAAQKLKSEEGLITILRENLFISMLLGEMYMDNKKSLKTVIERLSVKVTQQESLAIESWEKTLRENPGIFKQYITVAQAFASEQVSALADQLKSGMDKKLVAEDIRTSLGIYEDPETRKIIFNDLPSDEFMEYIVDNEDKYKDLLDAFVQSYVSYPLYYEYAYGSYLNDYYTHRASHGQPKEILDKARGIYDEREPASGLTPQEREMRAARSREMKEKYIQYEEQKTQGLAQSRTPSDKDKYKDSNGIGINPGIEIFIGDPNSPGNTKWENFGEEEQARRDERRARRARNRHRIGWNRGYGWNYDRYRW